MCVWCTRGSTSVRADPLTGGIGRQRASLGGLRRKRIDAEAVCRQLADANRRIRQHGQRVQGAVVLRRDVAERLLVDLIEVEPVAAAQHSPAHPPRGRRRIPRAARCSCTASLATRRPDARSPATPASSHCSGMSPHPGSSNRCRSAPPGSASGAASFASRPGTRSRTDCMSLRDSAQDPTPFIAPPLACCQRDTIPGV